MISLLILCAALLHAIWNSLVKTAASSFLQIALLQVFGGIIAFLFIPGGWLPAPEAYNYLILSIVIHFAYYLLLSSSYRFGELSLVYPIARGSGPAIVAFVSPFVSGEHMSSVAIFGLGLLCSGIVLTGLARGNLPGQRQAIVFALLTGLTIAAYTVVDGLGARAAGDALQFIRSLYLGEALSCLLAALLVDRTGAVLYAKKYWRVGIFNACIASLAYGIVIWAMMSRPMAYVAALRETSVVFAVLIGVLILKESFGRSRICASLLVLLGALLLHC